MKFEQTTPNENFRDSISTIMRREASMDFPKNKRKVLQLSETSKLFAIAFARSTFIKIQGNQFLLFNILERRFNIFGLPFWPQDFYLFVFSMIIGVVFITLFTVAFGRIFCGWICPQTIFMEFVFRRIEYWIEGDRGAQIRLSKQKWNSEKIFKKSIKHLLFYVISFVIANVFLAYFIGSDQLLNYIVDGPQKHTGTLISLLIFTTIFYFIFHGFANRLRHCLSLWSIAKCTFDNQSIVVATIMYVERENRGVKELKNEDRKAMGHGDCIVVFNVFMFVQQV